MKGFDANLRLVFPKVPIRNQVFSAPASRARAACGTAYRKNLVSGVYGQKCEYVRPGSTKVLTTNLGSTKVLTTNLGSTKVLTANLGSTKVLTANLGSTKVLTTNGKVARIHQFER